MRRDPSSWFAAASEGWEYPFPRLEAQIADLWDLEHAKAGTKQRVTYPRPYAVPAETRQRGNAAGRSREEVIAILHGEHFGQPEAPA